MTHSAAGRARPRSHPRERSVLLRAQAPLELAPSICLPRGRGAQEPRGSGGTCPAPPPGSAAAGPVSSPAGTSSSGCTGTSGVPSALPLTPLLRQGWISQSKRLPLNHLQTHSGFKAMVRPEPSHSRELRASADTATTTTSLHR